MKIKLILTTLILFAFIISTGCSSGGGDGDNTTPSSNACSQLGLMTRIINGTECSEVGSPVVQINLRLPTGDLGLCSGTLITPTYVLTAAHCFFEDPIAASVEVNGRLIPGSRFLVHPDVDIDSSSLVVLNDAAIIELSQPLTGVPTLPILGSRSVNSGNIISTFGYGQDEMGAVGVLQSGEMKVSEVNQTHIAARFDGDGSNPCFGDSGGPAILSFQDDNGADVDAVVGIVSSGELITCLSGDRTLFTNATTSSVFDFITRNVPGVSVK
ncbi:MAG: trypsin-like serine protease [Bdellovibrionales bacterium]|nr:trypsin-like serine protease [Bdellovibrionales bacterium]